MTAAEAEAQARLLIVDDDVSICRTLAMIFRRFGFATEIAHSGREAVELTREAEFDIAFLDIKLPDMSGMELLRPLTSNCPDLSTIMITAHASTETAVRALNGGASAYVTKPFNVDEVMALVRGCLEKQRLLRENRELFRQAQQELAMRREAEAEREALRSQIYQADRMANLGQLAASVAHEINTPLSYLLFNLESLVLDLPGVALAVECISQPGAISADLDEARAVASASKLEDMVARARDALEGARRVRDIVRDLRVFSRVQEERDVMVSLNDVLEAAVNMTFNEVRYRARLVKEYGEIPTILANDGRLSQVFLNLLINAAQAIEDDDVSRNQIRIRTWSEQGEVLAEVSDTGKGINEAELEQIFEPFFSTKPEGVGCGLGLAICKGIVEDYNGRIEVESTPGVGTRFTVRLPVNQPEEVVRRKLTPLQSPAVAAAPLGRILVIDDDPLFGDAVRRSLLDEFVVAVADSGDRGKAILVEDDKFDLVLCDLLMAGTSGMDLYQWLLDANPRLAERVIFMTGGAFTPRARKFQQEVPNLHLEKPFDPLYLRSLLRELISRRPPQDA